MLLLLASPQLSSCLIRGCQKYLVAPNQSFIGQHLPGPDKPIFIIMEPWSLENYSLPITSTSIHWATTDTLFTQVFTPSCPFDSSEFPKCKRSTPNPIPSEIWAITESVFSRLSWWEKCFHHWHPSQLTGSYPLIDMFAVWTQLQFLAILNYWPVAKSMIYLNIHVYWPLLLSFCYQPRLP